MSRRVVIVDDSKLVVMMTKRFFTNDMGYEVVAAGHDGQAAVDLYREHRPDLLTLDISMPGMDGLQALKAIRGEFPEARVLIISAVRDETRSVCRALGACEVLAKPLNFNDPKEVARIKAVVEGLFQEQTG